MPCKIKNRVCNNSKGQFPFMIDWLYLISHTSTEFSWVVNYWDNIQSSFDACNKLTPLSIIYGDCRSWYAQWDLCAGVIVTHGYAPGPRTKQNLISHTNVFQSLVTFFKFCLHLPRVCILKLGKHWRRRIISSMFWVMRRIFDTSWWSRNWWSKNSYFLS